MPDYYVALAKEYLEMQGFLVRTETKYEKREKDKRGIERTSWPDIDILAAKIKGNEVVQTIIGEVKGESQTEQEVKDIYEKNFDNPFVKRKLEDLIGSVSPEKWLFCFSWGQKERKFAEKLGIKAISMSEMISYLVKELKKHKGWFYERDSPNLMLLQFLRQEPNLIKDP